MSMLLAKALERLVTVGALDLIGPDGRRHRVRGDGSQPKATVRIADRATVWRILINPRLAIGEAYMDGTLTLEEGTLYDFVEVLARNIGAIEATPLVQLSFLLQRFTRFVEQYNPVSRAQRNVAHHYDLSDALYDLFLDRDRQYSCAYFTSPRDTLDQAQAAKKQHILAKLLVEPHHKVLDIGSGWGGLGLHIAERTGADITGITLSTEQHAVSNRRAREAGLDGRLRFELQDYRQVAARYDRIVSVGMFEHVGAAHHVQFFRKAKEMLAEDGVMLLHSIGRMEPPGGTNPWLRKYIFPGGYSPALSEVIAAVEKVGLWITDIEILRLHYAETIRHWRTRFLANRERVKALAGYDDRFCRMWEFYLTGCELGFRHLNQMVFQMQLARRPDATPMTRDYMVDAERAGSEVVTPRVAAE
jgi:cyclopropane-fatty-acyl-phospholipid synthase